MNGLFGPYIEKWMHLITIKNMLLLAIGSLIITDLGLSILILLFPKSPFFKTLIWEVISPVELEVVSIIGYVLGIAVFILVTSGILYGIFKVFKGQVTYKQLVADLLLSSVYWQLDSFDICTSCCAYLSFVRLTYSRWYGRIKYDRAL